MKKYLRIILPLAVLAFALGACSDDDKWGQPKVYMPQAVILDGGITNDYPVPLNNNNTTKNYRIDGEDKLHVTLGVYRSGLHELLSYTVKVETDPGAGAAAVAASSNRVLLPDGYWSLPSTVTVPDGEREQIFDLVVDIPRLQEDFPEYYTSRMVLAVSISEPSRYELNPDISTAIVVIDGRTFLDPPTVGPNPPGPELVAGGALLDGDDEYWNWANIQNAPLDKGLMKIGGGKLIIDSSVIDGDHLAEYWTELEEELVPGAVYTFTMDVTTDGNASSAELNIGIAPEHSSDGYRYPIKNSAEGGGAPYKDYFFASIHTWSDPYQLSSPFTGVLPRDAGYVFGFEKGSTEFIAGDNQKYLCIQVCTWGGSMGVITIENISIREKR